MSDKNLQQRIGTVTPPGSPLGAVPENKDVSPWPALWALILGFFMILIDTTIVSVANPSIQHGLHTDTNSVIWVTSAYLLSYAVPLLIAGRLGDRFGPKNIYLIGLVIFTLSSLWCGLSDHLGGSGIEHLITARAVQGLGGALMTPQTMAVITRTFPAAKRGQAMALWGATAGVATLVGPLLGGALVVGPGWEWIFFINVPIGVVAFILAVVLVPKLETRNHAFDWLGVVLSAIGMFFLVFGLQEGNTYNWNGWVWGSIVGGVVVIGLFVLWQRLNKKEPLMPLEIFKDRNFTLANVAIMSVGFAITAMFIPLVYFFQTVRGMTAIESALMVVPSAVGTMVFSPISGRLSDKVHPRYLVVPGIVLVAGSLFLYAAMLSSTIPVGWLLIPAGVMGIGSAFMWAPLSSTATRNLEPRLAGAGSGVFNAMRQTGSVVGSAAIASLMGSRITTELTPVLEKMHIPASQINTNTADSGAVLPSFLHAGFTTAMAQALILPGCVLVLGIACALFFVLPKSHQRPVTANPEGSTAPGSPAEPLTPTTEASGARVASGLLEGAAADETADESDTVTSSQLTASLASTAS